MEEHMYVTSKTLLIIVLFSSLSFTLLVTQPGCKGDVTSTPTVGPEWKIFTLSNSPLQAHPIHSIAADRRGIVWIANGDGGYSYSLLAHSWGNLSESLYTWILEPAPIRSRDVSSVTYAKDNAIWFGFRNGELIRYDPYALVRKFVWRRIKDSSFTNSEIAALDAMRADWSRFGEIWAATSTGMKRFIQEDADGGGTWVSYQVRSYYDNHVLCARTNSVDNTVWFGTLLDQAVIQAEYDPRFQFLQFSLPPGSNYRVNSISFDADTAVWIAQFRTIHKYNISTRKWNYYTYENTAGQLPYAEIRAVESNHPNNHWFGTDSGLVRLADTTWSRFTTANSSLPDDHVTFLQYDALGNLWIGTTRGLAVYNPFGTRL